MTRTVILRTAQHELVAAFTCPMIDLFIAGPAASPPDVVFFGTRVFSFSTLDDTSVTFTEAFAFALVDGHTCSPLPKEEMEKLDFVQPRVIFNG